jgi:hypothetical protein
VVHGLFNRCLQSFLADTYGAAIWAEIAQRIELDPPGFEALLVYDDTMTDAMLEAAATVLIKPVEEILEDAGTYLVSHPSTDAVRRLLRFGGGDFTSFLHSLDDLPDRARMAIPDLDLPRLTLGSGTDGSYLLDCRCAFRGYCHMILGALRAIGDDYGALVSLELEEAPGQGACITIRVFDTGFAKGRSFALGLRAS